VNASRHALGLLGLAAVGLWYFAGGAQSPVATGGDSSSVSAPLTHENLSVYFIHGEDAVPNAQVLTLQEALQRELAVVHETSNVNLLTVENRSPEYDLFIQSGDIVKGGRQDRVAATDVLLSPNSGVVPLPVNCVEHGRWTGREREDARQFHSSTQYAAGKELKYANVTFQQPAVWQNVAMNQSKLNANLQTPVNAAVSPTSFQLTLEVPALKAKIAEYEAALKAAGEQSEDIIGVVFVVNGQVAGADVYGSNALFRKAWPKLLGAAAVEAIAERTAGPVAAAPSAREVERFLARGAAPEPAARGPLDAAGSDLAPDSTDRALISGLRQVNNSNLNREQLDRVLLSLRRGEVRTHGSAGTQSGPVDQRAAGVAQPVPAPSLTTSMIAGGAEANPGFRFHAVPSQPASSDGGVSRAAASSQPARSNSNRLSSTRAENDSTLLIESRDPARQNAVIHRSYFKK
jgi:hypothetical protein